MESKLPKDAFMALAAMSWADGSVRDSERKGLAAAAAACGLSDGEVKEIEAKLGESSSLEGFVPGDMTDWQRAITYALAVWLARVDGVQSTDESDSLRQLAKQLDLSDDLAVRCATAANDVICTPEGRPDKFDFVALVDRLRAKLPHVAPK